jgi:hypothetical protein
MYVGKHITYCVLALDVDFCTMFITQRTCTYTVFLELLNPLIPGPLSVAI